MSVPLRIAGDGAAARRDLEDLFVAEAKKAGLLQLFGFVVRLTHFLTRKVSFHALLLFCLQSD
jgi:hypothetical protein